jgi:hypothetical protein
MILNDKIKQRRYLTFLINKSNKLSYIIFLNNNKNNIHFIGIDFEFNNKLCGLCQILYCFKNKFRHIYLIDFNVFTPDELNLIIDTTFTSNITRVMHGSESMDIPFVYNTLLKRDINKIILFNKTLIDTLFICQYLKSRKCSLYDMLKFFNVIDDNTYNYLNDISDLGPMYKLYWNVNKLSDKMIKYAAYDVIYLKLVYDVIRSKHKEIMKRIKYYYAYVLLVRNDLFKFYNDNINNISIKDEDIKDDILNIDYFRKIILKTQIFIKNNQSKHELLNEFYNILVACKLNKLMKIFSSYQYI